MPINKIEPIVYEEIFKQSEMKLAEKMAKEKLIEQYIDKISKCIKVTSTKIDMTDKFVVRAELRAVVPEQNLKQFGSV